ncbi:astacin, partial [Cooperia oncophora]
MGFFHHRPPPFGRYGGWPPPPWRRPWRIPPPPFPPPGMPPPWGPPPPPWRRPRLPPPPFHSTANATAPPAPTSFFLPPEEPVLDQPTPIFVPPDEQRIDPPAPAPTTPPPPLFGSPEIQRLVDSLNAHTTAFSKPGQGYENVIYILKRHMERRSRRQYVAGAMYEVDMALTVPQASQLTAQGRIKRKIIADVQCKMEVDDPPFLIDWAINDDVWQSRIRSVMRKFSQNTCLRFVERTDTDYLLFNQDVWQSRIRSVMRKFSQNTCLRFVERTDTDYLLFNQGEGCYASVGRLGGAQEISIGYGCETDGIISHEIGHSLGFYHEQARPDRDNYVTVFPRNAVPGLEGQFDKLLPGQSVDYG